METVALTFVPSWRSEGEHARCSPVSLVATGKHLLFIGVGEDHDEFIPAVPRKDVPVPQCVVNSVGDAGQEAVAENMPVRIVDIFEVVEVDDEQGEFFVVPLGPPDFVSEQFPEEPLVVEVGQRVSRGVVFEVPGVFVNGLDGADHVQESGQNAVDNKGADGVFRHFRLDAYPHHPSDLGVLQDDGFGLEFYVIFAEVRSACGTCRLYCG